jgi:hypothetical protein
LIKYKRYAINAINDRMLGGYTLCAAAEELNIPHWYYKRWRTTFVQVNKLASSDAVVPFKIHGGSRKIHPGCPSKLDPFEGELMHSIFEMRETVFLSTHVRCKKKLQDCRKFSRTRVPKQKYPSCIVL